MSLDQIDGQEPTINRQKTIPVENKKGGSTVAVAGEAVAMLRRAEEIVATSDATLAELTSLTHNKKPYNIFNRLRQRRTLKGWLEQRGFRSADDARTIHENKKTGALFDKRLVGENLTDRLDNVRTAFADYSSLERQRAHELLVKYDVTPQLLAACETQAEAQGLEPNIITWASQNASDEHDYAATDEQLMELLLWNAGHAERFVEHTDLEVIFDNFKNGVASAVEQGKLDASWAHAVPRVEKVEVGDILHRQSLGFEGGITKAVYTYGESKITIWPYELEGDTPIQHAIGHESTHALGGFNSEWLNEAFTERFALIAEGEDPNYESDVYLLWRRAVEQIMSAANKPFGDKEVSQYFLGEDLRQNEADLREFVRETYNGRDVIGALGAIHDEILKDSPTAKRAERTEQATLAVYTAADFIAQANRLLQESSYTNANIRYSLSTLIRKSSDEEAITYRHLLPLFEDASDTSV